MVDTCRLCPRPSSRPEHPALTCHIPAHKSVPEPPSQEGASTAASPGEPSYLPCLPCDRRPQLLHGRPHPSLSKHGTHPKYCSVVAAYYLGSLPRPLQKDTICAIVIAFDTRPSSALLCVCVHAGCVCICCVQASEFLCGVQVWNKVHFQFAHYLIRSEWLHAFRNY